MKQSFLFQQKRARLVGQSGWEVLLREFDPGDDKVQILAFSLGCELALAAMKAAISPGTISQYIDALHLVGAAVPHHAVPADIGIPISNIHSERDWILTHLYRRATGEVAAGTRGFLPGNDRLENIPVGLGHTQYKHVAALIAQRVRLFRPSD
ncbi:MAG: DUF726 domain-containing protein [Candidatus Binatia bacterium]